MQEQIAWPMTINDKNCNLPVVLTAMDKKLQKLYKGDTAHHHVRHLNVNVMLEAHYHAKFSWKWLSKAEILRFFTFQIGRRRHLLGGNKNLNGSHDHNYAPFGVIFYLFGKTSLPVYTKFDSSSLSRSLDIEWFESVIIN